MRIVFMGTPEAAVPSLRALHARFEVDCVYTRRDKARGRGLHLAPSPVKVAATELDLEIIQPKTLRGEAGALAGREPDAIVVVAYGMILPADVLAVPRLGCINLHFSLLPRWRGAAPVGNAILAGDERTGVTTMFMDEGLDTGPILHQVQTPVEPDDTAGTLTQRLAAIGADVLVRTLIDLEAGNVSPKHQDDGVATMAPKLDAADAVLDPAQPAAELERRVRAFAPTPGAFVWLRGQRLKVWRAAFAPGEGSPGSVVTEGGVLSVQTSDGRLVLLEVQLEGRKRMAADAFMRGHRLEAGERVGDAGG